MTFLNKNSKIPKSGPTDSQQQARRGQWPLSKAWAINSVTINSTGCVRGRFLADCMQGRK